MHENPREGIAIISRGSRAFRKYCQRGHPISGVIGFLFTSVLKFTPSPFTPSN
jgi:hypothetical protein